MSIWVVIVALLSIAATLGLASVLYRINAPQDVRRSGDGSGGDGGAFYAHTDDARSHHNDQADGGDAGSGGGDGGGD